MSDKRKPQAEPMSFEHLGGKKVGHPVPVQTEKEISFEHLGGRCVRKASEHPAFNAKPDVPEEKDNEAHTD